MASNDTKRFTFVSQGLPEDTFSVVQFKGTEGISRLYEYDITLASDDPEIDLKGVLQNPATLTIHGDDQDRPIHGILAQFEQLHEVKRRYFYRALLAPTLWQADLYRENQLFLDKTVPGIIEEILKQAGLTTQDYELKLTKNYSRWEYICQYRETDFDFISRWMEREGIYYFFEQGEQGEKLIITDSSTAHRDIPGNTTIPFAPPSGLMPEGEAIKAFICRQKRLPNRVILKDYNYRKPSLDLKTETVVDAKGRGNVYFYGEHFKTPEEGHELAKVRAEEIRCRENVFHGEGTEPGLCPGFVFEMAGHYRGSYNQKYLTVEIEHQGGQTEALAAGTGDDLTPKEQQLTYSNTFTAIPANIQFRPECNTPKPRFYGAMNAKVDAAGDGKYAELDDQGRYKVKLPFDQGVTDGGKASRWIRMAQPYAGAEHGMHFPLHKGTEVLLTFVDGDPDRPIIASAVPNSETLSPVTAANQSESVIQTGGNNKIRIEDKLGAERIIMESPTANSWVRIGAPNDPANGKKKVIKDKDGIKIKTDGDFVEEAGGDNEVIAKGDCTILARKNGSNGGKAELRIELNNNKMLIDTGERDFEINCDHFRLNNSKEDNITEGDDYEEHRGKRHEVFKGDKDEEHYGKATEKFYGDKYEEFHGNSDEHFRGDKLETFHGSSGEWHMGHKIEGLLGPAESFSIAQSLEMYLGAKEEFSLTESFELFLGLKQEIALGSIIGICIPLLSALDIHLGNKMEISTGWLVQKGPTFEYKTSEFTLGQNIFNALLGGMHMIG